MNNASSQVPDEIIDRAYEVMSEELVHWQIVGPQLDRNVKPPREFYTAVRAPEKPSLIEGLPLSDEQKPKIIYLKDKAHAVACVQWHGLQAVVTELLSAPAPALGAGPSSSKGGTPTSQDN